MKFILQIGFILKRKYVQRHNMKLDIKKGVTNTSPKIMCHLVSKAIYSNIYIRCLFYSILLYILVILYTSVAVYSQNDKVIVHKITIHVHI